MNEFEKMLTTSMMAIELNDGGTMREATDRGIVALLMTRSLEDTPRNRKAVETELQQWATARGIAGR
jgi:hypothetical protein